MIALPACLSAQTPPPVVLDPFRVDATQDRGYRAGNSVSATRIAVPIKDLPFALNAFTEEFISDIAPVELLDIVKFAPGVTGEATNFALSGGGAGNMSRYNIRGFRSQRPQRDGFTGATNTDPVSVSRIEVVKGPASLLYGQINPGGIVNVITKKPQRKAAYSVRQQVGTDEFLRSELDATGPLTADGSLTYRLTAAWEQVMEYMNPMGGSLWAAVPAVRWEPMSNLVLNASFERYRRDDDPQPMMFPNLVPNALPNAWGYAFPAGATVGPPPPTLPRDFNYSSNHDFKDTRVDSLFADATYSFGRDWTLRLSGSYLKNYIGHFQTGLAAVGSATNRPNEMQRRVRYEIADDFSRNFQAEVAGLVTLGRMKWRPLVGASYQESGSVLWSWVLPTALFPANWDLTNPATWNRDTSVNLAELMVNSRLTTPNTIPQVSNTSKGYYTVHSLSFAQDRFLVLGGVRRSETTTQSTNLMTGVRQPKFSAAATTPQVGAMFRLLPSVGLYASYSQSFFPVPQLLRVNEVPTHPAQPTEGTGYEAGLKLDLNEGRFSATVAVYEIRNENIVQTFTIVNATGNNFRTDVQSGEQKSEGVEVDFTWSPVDGFQLYGAFSYSDAFVATNPAFPTFVGRPLPATPKHLASAYARYNFQREALKGWFVHGGLVYTGTKSMRDVTESPNLYYGPSRVVDLTIGRTWRVGRREFSASLSGRNLLDEFYFNGNNAPPAAPRNFVLSTAVRF